MPDEKKSPEDAAETLLNVLRTKTKQDENLLRLAAICAFLTAAEAVERLWDHTGTNMGEGYPKCLPSFDEFVAEVRNWFQTQEEVRKRRHH